jgi:hypothetical protein
VDAVALINDDEGVSSQRHHEQRTPAAELSRTIAAGAERS